MEGLLGSLFLIVMLAKAVAAWQPRVTRPREDHDRS
jgi:hypothetical protein